MGATDWDDPHGVLPQSFKDQYRDCDTVDEALSRAEQRPSTTPLSEQGVCPECGSRRVRSKPSMMQEMPNKVETPYKCTHCGAHFEAKEDPIPMTHYEPEHAFEWLSPADLAEPDECGMNALFAGLDDETRVALAIRLYRPCTDDGPSYRELEELFPHSRQWIGSRVREWKAGDHRELVEQPTPTGDASSDATALATDGGRRSRWAAYGSD